MTTREKELDDRCRRLEGERDYARLKMNELSDLVSRIWAASKAESDGRDSIVDIVANLADAQAQLHRLEGERDQLREALTDAVQTARWEAASPVSETERNEKRNPDALATAQAQLADLREALRTYGHHHARCAKRREPPGWDCDCGLFAALSPDPIPTGDTRSSPVATRLREIAAYLDTLGGAGHVLPADRDLLRRAADLLESASPSLEAAIGTQDEGVGS